MNSLIPKNSSGLWYIEKDITGLSLEIVSFAPSSAFSSYPSISAFINPTVMFLSFVSESMVVTSITDPAEDFTIRDPEPPFDWTWMLKFVSLLIALLTTTILLSFKWLIEIALRIVR